MYQLYVNTNSLLNINSSYGRTNNNSLAREAAATTVHMFICTFSITFFFERSVFITFCISFFHAWWSSHASNDIKITDDFLLYTAESVIVLNMKTERMVIKLMSFPWFQANAHLTSHQAQSNSGFSNIGEKWDKLTTYQTMLCHVVELWDS